MIIAYWKDLFREIRLTLGRFFSLLIITALGSMSVVGIQAASMDMRAVADKTYKAHNLYDLQIKSTTGFNEDDLIALKSMETVSGVMPTNMFDVFVSIDNVNSAVRTYALPDTVNNIDLLEGRFPTNPHECAIEQRLLREGGFTIGDTIQFSLEDMDAYHDFLSNYVFTIVGVVSSPLYITFQRGNTSLGDGSLQYYLYLHPDAYTLEVFTDVYLTMDGSQDMDNITDEYYATAEGWKAQIETVGELRIQALENELIDAQREIDDGWEEYFNGLDELEEKSENGWQELEDARELLSDAKEELEDAQRTLDESVADGLSEIDRNERELKDGQNELNSRREELDAGQAQIDEARQQIQIALSGLAMIAPEGVSPELDAQYSMVSAALLQLEQQQTELDEGRAAIDDAQRRLNYGRRQINDARETLEEERVKAQAEIDDGWIDYYDGLRDYNDGVATLESEVADAQVELADAKLELEDAQKKLDDAPVPEWYYFTRKDGTAFDSYYQDTLRLQQIGYVFPLVFFVVAIMVALTTMSRMVEEHRTQIGIYMALGYRATAIMGKYLFYAFASGIIGGVAGVFLGSRIFPIVILDAYSHLYDMPSASMPVPGFISVVAAVAAVLSVVLVTLWTCIKSITGAPALLMRPKAPKIGKRVWLERIPFLWNRFSFFSKVTSRNIFRYKPRFAMSLFGVAGCSALLITAFGLSDSISGVANLHYETIVNHDARAYLRDITSEKQRDEIDKALPAGHLYIREEAVTASGERGSLSATLIAPDNSEALNDYFTFGSPRTKAPVEMTSQSVLLTEKLSRVTGVGIGEKITMTFNDGRSYSAKVTGVVENYLLHYIYMSPDIYKEIFVADPYPNGVLIKYDNGREFAAGLLENADVRAVIHNDDLNDMIGSQANAMGVVTIVLIVIACALALVVLFNLTNINITERIRELATIKVLGFYNSELAMYIYRENIVVTLLGVVIGVVGGVFLHSYVVSTVEIDILKFPQIIKTQSFVLAVALTLVFAVFVNLVMIRRLARIDMVESLKSVE